MAETTNISWCDATFNPWWGCTKVAPGCDNCYAAAMDKRVGGDHWGTRPRVMSDNNWKLPHRLNRKAIKENKRLRVFSGSMCDVFDKNAPEEQRERLWQVIRETPNLDWLLLTKRAPNIKKYLPDDWGEGYENVWLGVTVEDIEHGYPRIDHLRNVPSAIKFLSIEPLLEPLNGLDVSGIDWVIVGGESGSNAREMSLSWVLDIFDACSNKLIPFFFKQHGGRDKDKGGCLINGNEFKEFPG